MAKIHSHLGRLEAHALTTWCLANKEDLEAGKHGRTIAEIQAAISPNFKFSFTPNNLAGIFRDFEIQSPRSRGPSSDHTSSEVLARLDLYEEVLTKLESRLTAAEKAIADLTANIQIFATTLRNITDPKSARSPHTLPPPGKAQTIRPPA